MEPFKGHGGGKNLGWEENIFLSQNQLSSDNLFLFTLQLAVITARMFTMEWFIQFCFELGLNKVIVQSVLSSRHGFGTV